MLEVRAEVPFERDAVRLVGVIVWLVHVLRLHHLGKVEDCEIIGNYVASKISALFR
jgi:hypothetical protein